LETMNAKLFFVPALTVAALLAAGLAPTTVRGQAAPEAAAVTALLAEVAAQQVVIAENQTKIDAKLAAAAESVRIARLFVSRGGGKAQ
jgi:DUF917 family protein